MDAEVEQVIANKPKRVKKATSAKSATTVAKLAKAAKPAKPVSPAKLPLPAFPALADISTYLHTCQRCPLHKEATQVVPGLAGSNMGVAPIKLMLVGLAPGEQEDRGGQPFVGPAGHTLNRLLSKAGLSREDAWITNINKHRPMKIICRKCKLNKEKLEKYTGECVHVWKVDNRDTRETEQRACLPFLQAEIQLLQPQVIIPLGNIAVGALEQRWTLSVAHGVGLHRGNSVMVPMYHPAAGLHNPAMRPVLIEDFNRLQWAINHPATAPDTSSYVLVDTPAKLQQAVAACTNKQVVAVDLETEGLQPHDGSIVGVSLAAEHGKSFFIPTIIGWFTPQEVVEALRSLLADSHIVKVFANAKFDLQFLWSAGLSRYTEMAIDDTMVMAHLLHKEHLGLKELALRELNVEMVGWEQLTGSRSMTQTMHDDPTATMQYAGADTDMTLRLHSRFIAEMAEG